MTSLRFRINEIFNGLVTIFKIAILFIQLSLYRESEAISEVPNKYIFVESGNGIGFFWDRLYVL